VQGQGCRPVPAHSEQLGGPLSALPAQHPGEIAALPGVDTLADVGAAMDPSTDPVVYAGTCGLGDGTVAHLVIDTPFGPVTVLVMPDQAVPKRRQIGDDGLRAVLLPFGNGGLAVVGQSPEAVTRVEAFARRALRPAPT